MTILFSPSCSLMLLLFELHWQTLARPKATCPLVKVIHYYDVRFMSRLITLVAVDLQHNL